LLSTGIKVHNILLGVTACYCHSAVRTICHADSRGFSSIAYTAPRRGKSKITYVHWQSEHKYDISFTSKCTELLFKAHWLLHITLAVNLKCSTFSPRIWLDSVHFHNYRRHLPITILDISHHPVFYLKTQHYRDWNLSPSSEGTYSDKPNRKSETSSLYWAHLSRFHLKTATNSSLRIVSFLNKRQGDG
jgi:hypothetical protein